MSRSSHLTYEQCHAYFDLPVSQAATALGVSRPTISKVLRARGIPRWPYRKLRALGKLHEWRQRREAAQRAAVGSASAFASASTVAPALWQSQCCAEQPASSAHSSLSETSSLHVPPPLENEYVQDEICQAEFYVQEEEPQNLQQFRLLDACEHPDNDIDDDNDDETFICRMLETEDELDGTINACALDDALPTHQQQIHMDFCPSSVAVPQHDIFKDEPQIGQFPPQCAEQFDSSPADWECSETLDSAVDQQVDDPPLIARPGGGGKERIRSLNRPSCPTGDSDDTSGYTVSTKSGVVHRVVLGEPNWSRGIFSPDGHGGLAFRFVGNETQSSGSHEGDICEKGSSLSISESDLYEAVGSQIDEPFAFTGAEG